MMPDVVSVMALTVAAEGAGVLRVCDAQALLLARPIAGDEYGRRDLAICDRRAAPASRSPHPQLG